MVKRLFIIVILFTSISNLQAQEKKSKQQRKEEKREKINQLIKQEEEGALVYAKQNAFGIKLTTDGYGFFFEKGKYKTVTKTNLFWVGLGERKHQKEEKRTNFYQQGSFLFLGNPYVYGKVNNFYHFELGFGQQRLIGGKGNKNGIAVSAIYGGGLSLGMLKPYYLNVLDQNTGDRKDIKYTQDTSTFLNSSVIAGSTGFNKGFSEISYVPGVTGRFALRFDYGKYNELLSAIEAGVNVAYYTKEMEQMAKIDGKKFFFNAYVSIVFGKRKS